MAQSGPSFQLFSRSDKFDAANDIEATKITSDWCITNITTSISVLFVFDSICVRNFYEMLKLYQIVFKLYHRNVYFLIQYL